MHTYMRAHSDLYMNVQTAHIDNPTNTLTIMCANVPIIYHKLLSKGSTINDGRAITHLQMITDGQGAKSP